jgi:hypothetical protein
MDIYATIYYPPEQLNIGKYLKSYLSMWKYILCFIIIIMLAFFYGQQFLNLNHCICPDTFTFHSKIYLMFLDYVKADMWLSFLDVTTEVSVEV